MTYEDLEHFAHKRVTYEVLSSETGEPIRGSGKVLEIDRDHISIANEAGEAAGTSRYALAEIVAVHPA